MEVEIDYQFKTLNTKQNEEYSKVEQCVKNVIQSEGYKNFSVDKKVFSPDGGNFLGVLCEVNIKGETSKTKKETNLFLKIMTASSEDMTVMSLSEIYQKELFFYKELAKVYEKLQDEAQIPLEDRYKSVRSYNESTQDVIVLENMSKIGYGTSFRKDTMTLEYAEQAVRTLAKFHALSFALEAKNPEYFERKIKPLKPGFTCNEEWKGFMQNKCEMVLDYLKDKNESRKKFADYILIASDRFVDIVSAKCARKVLCHGDFRPNNILMKQTNGVISDMITIDYQLMNYACPIFDFAYLIFPATNQDFRKTHLPYLKELYYSSMKSFLMYFNLDINKVYPKEDFERDYKEKLDFGLVMSILLVPLLMANENDLPDLTKGDWAGMNFEVDSRCKDRLVGIVEDFIELGYL